MNAPRYVTRPRMDWEDDRPMLEGKTIFEAEPMKTRLLDKDGQPLYRMKRSVGFVEMKARA